MGRVIGVWSLIYCLKKYIMVFSGSFFDVEMGKEYKLDEGEVVFRFSIVLLYYRYAFGFGEYYNFVVSDLSR